MFLKYRNILSLVMLFFAFSTCVEQTRSASVWNNGRFEVPVRDLDGILKEGKLRVVVDYNFTNYFVYKGKPMGFKYEILNRLAMDMGVKLEFFVTNDLEETFRGLETGRYDLAAKNLTVNRERAQRVDFTTPIFQTRQVLVQRTANAKDSGSLEYVETIQDLAGKTVAVPKYTSFAERLNEISSEIGADIMVEEDSLAGLEQLISMVSSGEIDFTVCDEMTAVLYAGQYSNIDISLPITGNQDLAWAVRKDTHRLQAYLDSWLQEYIATAHFRQLEMKYYASSRYMSRVRNGYLSFTDGKISPYDEIIQREAEKKGWDWRLIAAIIYQESQFDTEASSWAGASGLMQLMPETAQAFGVVEIHEPEENIRAGIKLLSWLDSQFRSEIQDDRERVYFVLAAYNVGLGHVKDAQRLAAKYGKDPYRWRNNVDYYLLNKSKAVYYSDPVTRWGYARGREPFEFVNSVLTYYAHYRNVIPS